MCLVTVLILEHASVKLACLPRPKLVKLEGELGVSWHYLQKLSKGNTEIVTFWAGALQVGIPIGTTTIVIISYGLKIYAHHQCLPSTLVIPRKLRVVYPHGYSPCALLISLLHSSMALPQYNSASLACRRTAPFIGRRYPDSARPLT
jgi:hypothetical protein